MNEIDRLKHEEQELMDDDLYSEEYVETLKVEESETYERPSHMPAEWNETPVEPQRESNWMPLIAVLMVIWGLSAGAIGGGSLWALFLLLPAYKNWQRVKEDRQSGRMTDQTRKSLRGAMFALLFTFMFIFNAWNIFFPLLLISWGVSAILANRWQSDPVYY